jgi:hypothetical protein
LRKIGSAVRSSQRVRFESPNDMPHVYQLDDAVRHRAQGTMRTRRAALAQSAHDLLIMCIVSSDAVQSVIAETPSRYEKNVRLACETCLHWYGAMVNINPALFNFTVLAYVRIRAADPPLDGDAFREFKASYVFEEENRFPRKVDGRLSTSVGDIERLLADIARAEGA